MSRNPSFIQLWDLQLHGIYQNNVGETDELVKGKEAIVWNGLLSVQQERALSKKLYRENSTYAGGMWEDPIVRRMRG